MKHFALVFALASICNANEEKAKVNEVNAELLILPPLVLGYEDLLEEPTTPSKRPTKPTKKPKEESKKLSLYEDGEVDEESADPENRYTLKFEGNFAIPKELAAQLKLDDTRKAAIESGLGSLLQQAVMQNLQGITLPMNAEAE